MGWWRMWRDITASYVLGPNTEQSVSTWQPGVSASEVTTTIGSAARSLFRQSKPDSFLHAWGHEHCTRYDDEITLADSPHSTGQKRRAVLFFILPKRKPEIIIQITLQKNITTADVRSIDDYLNSLLCRLTVGMTGNGREAQ